MMLTKFALGFIMFTTAFQSVSLHAQALTPQATARLDRDIQSILLRMQVPSASIALVKDGKIAYVKAYGLARLKGRVAARPNTRYAVGSVSKQFTATAMLMLAEDGKLSLDDPIGRYVPGVTAGGKITIRQLLNHSAGYADYWPIDYVSRDQKRAIAPTELVRRYATGPLDFQPGDDARYCNTCYVIAGLIIEKVSGEPLERFMAERIFRPLGLNDVVDIDLHPLGLTDATGYTRYAFGPLREAPVSGAGWLFATGALAFRADDLARWDIAMLNRSLLRPGSYEQQFAPGKHNDGTATIWGLGVQIDKVNGHSVIQHTGTVSGFTAINRIYPDDHDAIVVLTNTDFGGAARDAIVSRVAATMLPVDAEAVEDRSIYDLLREGRIDYARLTENARGYFTPEVLQDYRSSLAHLGDPISFSRLGKWQRGGFVGEAYKVVYPNQVVEFDLFKTHDGKFEEAIVYPPN